MREDKCKELKEIKERHKLNNSELARMIGVSVSAVWFWIEGWNKPSSESRGKLEAFLKDAERVIVACKRRSKDVTKALIAARLKSAMAEKGLTARELAKGADVSAASIYEWCRGTREPYSWNIELLAKYLGVSEEWLRGEADE